MHPARVRVNEMGQTPVVALLKTGNKRNSFTRQKCLGRLGLGRSLVLELDMNWPDDSAVVLAGHFDGSLLAV